MVLTSRLTFIAWTELHCSLTSKQIVKAAVGSRSSHLFPGIQIVAAPAVNTSFSVTPGQTHCVFAALEHKGE